eukprot:306570_1
MSKINELNIDKNNEIAFENLLDAAVLDYLIASDVRLFEAFRELDINETGKIQLDILKQKICEMDIYDNINDILCIINQVDLNHDGCIDYEEFLRALHPDVTKAPNWFWKNNLKNKVIKKSDTPIYDWAKDVINSQEEFEKKKEEKMNVNDDTVIVKEGWMEKQGKVIHSWKDRYFKLRKNGILEYYHDENETGTMNSFNVKILTRIKAKSWNHKMYGIKVYTPHRDWKFVCKNESERNEWMKAIGKISGQYK